MLSEAKVINIEEFKIDKQDKQDKTDRQSKNKMCEYKDVLYPIYRDENISPIKIKQKDGSVITKRTHRFYILVDRKKLYLNSDGNKVCNKQPGISSTVEFLTVEEVLKMKETFKSKIDNATTPTNELIAWKNYALFYCGINVGLRASDLRQLKWKHIYDKNGERINQWTFKAKKTGKMTTIPFNESFFAMIEKYRKRLIELKGKPHLEDYIFFSKKDDKAAISEIAMWNLLSETAIEAGIKKNIGSHSLRKTFGRNTYEMSKDKEGTLVMLSEWFKHDSIATTRRYIGLTDEMKKELAESIDGLFGEV